MFAKMPATDYGSPPRVRGTRSLTTKEIATARFTPTGVGKTRGSSRKICPLAVHPHGCGENVGMAVPGLPEKRFTPTGVGKTQPCAAAILHIFGSPPRVWGKRHRLLLLRDPARFTPTGVGKTQL